MENIISGISGSGVLGPSGVSQYFNSGAMGSIETMMQKSLSPEGVHNVMKNVFNPGESVKHEFEKVQESFAKILQSQQNILDNARSKNTSFELNTKPIAIAPSSVTSAQPLKNWVKTVDAAMKEKSKAIQGLGKTISPTEAKLADRNASIALQYLTSVMKLATKGLNTLMSVQVS